MLSIGLTGSIAVGKSFVCECFRELGCHVLDADKTARDVVAKGTEGLDAIVGEFGSEALQPDGSLDRKKLGAIVFADAERRERLNSIVHPRVIEEQDRWLRELTISDPDGIAIIDAALMIESGGYKRFDKMIVVWCKPDIQLGRLMLRDNLSVTEAQMRIDAQMSQDEKKRFADYLIDTSNGFVVTRNTVADVFRKLSSLTG